MIALVVAIVASLALAWQARHYAQRVERAQGFAQRANDRAGRAEKRADEAEARAAHAEKNLRMARETLLMAAEAARVDLEKRSKYAPPVRALPRPRVSEPAPACVECARREVLNAVAAASRTPVVDIELGTGPINPFVVRWGDA